MKEPVERFRNHFNNAVEKIQRFAFFVCAREFQETCIARLDNLLTECTKTKDRAIIEQAEDSANAFLAFEFMAKSLIEEFRFYLALKDDDPDAAWDHLVNAQSSAAAAMKSHIVASLFEVNVHRLHTLERLLFPQPVFFSSGFVFREAECSICGAEYGECDHIKGQPYMGKLCVRIVKEPDFQDISAVFNPADKHCRALHYADNGTMRNAFTQRVVGKEDVQHNAAQDGKSVGSPSTPVS